MPGPVAFGLLPVILFGGVIGAGVGSTILYAGLIEAGEAENIFEEAGEVKAHSPAEEKQVNIKAASCFEKSTRGFAAKFL
mmetsp:Transcript_18133/g.33135  ORF Transcript_18133/g.33135 Transcript_18133/m.33135 type:complete len:80 (-) Transcript_18133:349-588(-)|eukprot:CAMPEP_0175039884 /NCGR_PEP_ID=MMETSP0052_2-20121109/895_1 /TAXON_ID=51329 ORGANISM="Polytomella parva, Strain SAG 63-3" /NCGR_SAMPLE_ID=MMETSP0052_2 /ASSEMBLY_ACC=CAM_ASM_000194 /LENGTH=79 /DNA_ID=CAMNT_0016301913 /DNA_START=53 /DNA_END=292 /DNA_ORIENTATION=-